VKKLRNKIPDDLAAEVLFLADRTCCVCRDPNRKVEIHHIDSNPVNNVIENLATLCKDCHSDAHTTHAFARNLTPLLLDKYNQSWREIVRVRTNPGGMAGDDIEYRIQVLFHLWFEAAQWKLRYTDKLWEKGEFPERARHGDDLAFLLNEVAHSYTKEEWEYYERLFDYFSPKVADKLEQILSSYGDALSSRVKLSVLNTCSKLRGERIAFLNVPRIIQQVPDQKDLMFDRRFKDTLQALALLSKLVDHERIALNPA